MISITKNKILRAIGRTAVSTVFWLAVWEITYRVVRNDLFVASPLHVAARLGELAVTGEFWLSVGLSLLRILLGFLLGSVLGTLFAILTTRRVCATLFTPLRVLIQATPVASFIMLAWIWLKRDQIPVFIAMLIVLPVFWSNVRAGIRAVGRSEHELAKAYRFTRVMKLRHLYLPAVLPHFASAASAGAGLVWKAGIAAEVLCQPKMAIGTELFQAKSILETTDVFAWTAVVVFISLILEITLRTSLKRWETRWNT